MLKLNLSPANLSVGTHRIHYAWVVVMLAVAMRLTVVGIRVASSVIVPYLHNPRNFGWSYGSIGFAFSLQWMFSGFFGPPSGWLGDRYGVRRTLVLGALFYVVSMVLMGVMTDLWQFYLYFGILLSAAMAIFQVPLDVAVTMWFKEAPGRGYWSITGLSGVGDCGGHSPSGRTSQDVLLDSNIDLDVTLTRASRHLPDPKVGFRGQGHLYRRHPELVGLLRTLENFDALGVLDLDGHRGGKWLELWVQGQDSH